MKQDGKLLIAIGSGIIFLSLAWDRFIQFAIWYLEKFGHPDEKIGLWGQLALLIGLALLGRGIYLVGKDAKEMEKLVDEATKPKP